MIFHQPSNSRSNYNFNIAVFRDTVWDFHFHKNLELIYVLKGAVNCTVNNTAYRLTVGDFGLCLPYDIHSYVPEENTEYWVLVFSEDFIRYFANQIEGKTALGYSFRCDEDEEEYIVKKLITASTPTILTLKSCLYALCERYKDSVELVETYDKRNTIIANIVDYISGNHTKNITLKDLSDELGYDYSYTSHRISDIFNMTFPELVNLYRLETAMALLESTEKTITQIAYESGYQSIRAFNFSFKKSTGVSPSEYKKRRGC